MFADKENIYEKIIELTKKVPTGYRISLCSTLVTGLIAHIMCYTNMWPSHDDASFYGNAKLNIDVIISGITGLRPLAVPIGFMLRGYYLPVVCAVVFFLAFSIGSWKFCQTVSIKHPIAIATVAALFVTFPGATAINLYSGNNISFSITFLASILTVYFLYKDYKRHYLWSFLSLLVVVWTYPGYISLVLSLFLSIEIIGILFGRNESFGNILKRHIIMLLMSGGLLSLTFLLTKIVVTITGEGAQERIQNVLDFNVSSNLPKQQGTLTYRLLKNYTRNTSHILKFWKFEISRNIPVLMLSIMCLALLAAALIIIYFKRRPFANKGWFKFAIMVFDVLCMPLALNTVAFVGPTHLLMQFSFITPWIFVMTVSYRLIMEHGDWILTRISSVVTMAALFLTIIGWQFTANVAYVQAYANYTAGISVANRIVYRIESIDGYKPGETPVVFLGNARKISFRDNDGFGVLDNYTAGMGPWYDTAFTYADVFMNYIVKEMNVNMQVVEPDEIDFSKLPVDSEKLKPYPFDKCYEWYEGTLYFKVAE